MCDDDKFGGFQVHILCDDDKFGSVQVHMLCVMVISLGVWRFSRCV